MGSVTKLSVNMTARAMTSLEQAAALTGDSRTDTVNRAMQVYAAIVALAEGGGGIVDLELFVWRDCEVTVKPGPSRI